MTSSLEPEQKPPRDEASLSECADELEERMIGELRAGIVAKSALFNLADGWVGIESGAQVLRDKPGQYMLMGDDPRLPVMPDRPTLTDFFELRCGSIDHLLQSAAHARRAGLPEKQVAACLLHDIAVGMFIRVDHGYWGAQMLEPYVDEEIVWAIRAHQALRFYPDPALGYEYPDLYVKNFGPHYRPDEYIEAAYRAARGHKWYMTARMITIFDIYSFDPNAKVELSEFTDVLAKYFRQPEEGLGYDGSPVAHMWRTIIRPTKYL